jgi:hypothetical protein
MRPPVVAELHPGGPAGQWVSISLVEPDGPRSWLFVRLMVGDEVSVAYGDDGDEGSLNWGAVRIGAMPWVLREFAENYAESCAAHCGVVAGSE